MVDWRIRYENDRLKKKKKKTILRLDFESRIEKILNDLEKVKQQAWLLNCKYDFAIAKASLRDLRMMMRNAKKTKN